MPTYAWEKKIGPVPNNYTFKSVRFLFVVVVVLYQIIILSIQCGFFFGPVPNLLSNLCILSSGISNLALLLVVFKRHRDSERVKKIK